MKIQHVNTQIRLFFICITYPDTDHILIPGVNGVGFFSNASCLYFPEEGWLYCHKTIIYVFSKISALVFSRFVHAFHKRDVFFALLLVSRRSPSLCVYVTLIPDLLPCWWKNTRENVFMPDRFFFFILFSFLSFPFFQSNYASPRTYSVIPQGQL